VTVSRQKLGRWGEQQAGQYLTERGYAIIASNVRTPYGELDLIARQPDGVIVFVEVKTSQSSTFGHPEVSVTARKSAHIQASAQAYLQSQPDLPGDYRVDVIAIQVDPSGRNPEIVHFENAIS
jgi:putative endonuclease